MTASRYTAPGLSGEYPSEPMTPAVTLHQFWTSLMVSMVLFAVASLVGGEALSFEGASSAPQHTTTP